jgi:hypothetical protein
MFFYDEVVGLLKVIVRAEFPFPFLNFTNRGVSAVGGGMAYKEELKEFNTIRFVG